ncbi:MAG: co-chaperone GroES [Patescibacteria group bacterium]
MVRRKKLSPASPAGRLKPTAGYLVIEPMEAKTKTDSGIYLPESAEEKPQKGRVLAIGPDEITEQGTKRPSPVSVGDIVIYKKWGGNEVKVEGKEYLFSKFEDILAIES